jgi:hypothetical protein
MDTLPLAFDAAAPAVRTVDDRFDQLIHTIQGYRFRFASEADLQDGIETALKRRGQCYEREKVLSPQDRPDFLVDGLAVEVKVDGSLPEALRQVARYAAHDRVEGILLVGTPAWLARIPHSIGGKPLHQLRLVGSML